MSSNSQITCVLIENNEIREILMKSEPIFNEIIKLELITKIFMYLSIL
ncbi:hypothetical protein pb186bvf_014418 [Paramecium bursaria]